MGLRLVETGLKEFVAGFQGSNAHEYHISRGPFSARHKQILLLRAPFLPGLFPRVSNTQLFRVRIVLCNFLSNAATTACAYCKIDVKQEISGQKVFNISSPSFHLFG